MLTTAWSVETVNNVYYLGFTGSQRFAALLSAYFRSKQPLFALACSSEEETKPIVVGTDVSRLIRSHFCWKESVWF
jgi:hypothetical protein